MNHRLKTRLESLGFRQNGFITLGQRQIPVFDMKQVEDTLKTHGNAPSNKNSVQNSCQ